MFFRVLGPLEVLDGEGRPLRLGRPKQRALLGLLVMRANQVVSCGSIAEVLWAGRPPASAAANLQSYVAGLRAVLGGPDRRLCRQPGGYRLRVDPDELDAAVFERLAATGRAALGHGDPANAAQRLARALGQWRGAVLDGLDLPALEPDRVRLEELRVAAAEDGIEARLALGAHAEAIAELEALVRRHPLRERLWGQLMVALHRAGRRADALAAYTRVTAHLDDAIGVRPDRDLRRLYERILAGDPPARGATGAAPR